MRQILISAGLLLPLGLDTFALAAALGMAGLEPRDRMRVSLVFTLFEAAMPIVGLLAGRVIGSFIGDWAGFVGIAVLVVAGLLLLRPDAGEGDETRHLSLLAQARGLAVVTLGLSISLDELTVGLSAGLLGLSIAVTVIWLAIQAFLAAQAGLRFGARLGEEILERSEQAAGAALIVVAAILLLLKLLKI